MLNHLLGGNESYAVDRQMLDVLGAIVPQLAVAATDAAGFIERALRWAVLRQGIVNVLVLGVDIPPAEPLHTAVWHATGLRPGDGRVLYLEDDMVLTAKARALLIDSPSVDVVVGDPAEPTGTEQVQVFLDPCGDPVVTVIPGLMDRLDDERAAAMIGEIRRSSPPGSYLIATHALDPETAAAEKLAAAICDLPYVGPVHFRTRRQIADLMPGRPHTHAVGPARDWFPVGPSMPQSRVLASDLVAGVVETL